MYYRYGPETEAEWRGGEIKTLQCTLYSVLCTPLNDFEMLTDNEAQYKRFGAQTVAALAPAWSGIPNDSPRSTTMTPIPRTILKG